MSGWFCANLMIWYDKWPDPTGSGHSFTAAMEPGPINLDG